MKRTSLLLCSSLLKSLGMTFGLIAVLILAQQVSQAEAVVPDGGVCAAAPNDLQQTCPNSQPCVVGDTCSYILVSQPNKPNKSYCLCVVTFGGGPE